MFKERCFIEKHLCKLYSELVKTAVIMLIFRVCLCCQNRGVSPYKKFRNLHK